jgi:magnesium-transporting ATPase (P-type)
MLKVYPDYYLHHDIEITFTLGYYLLLFKVNFVFEAAKMISKFLLNRVFKKRLIVNSILALEKALYYDFLILDKTGTLTKVDVLKEIGFLNSFSYTALTDINNEQLNKFTLERSSMKKSKKLVS